MDTHFIVNCLFDQGQGWRQHEIPGQSLREWMGLLEHDYDEVDRLLIEHETIGA